jgi:hypothetical protein
MLAVDRRRKIRRGIMTRAHFCTKYKHDFFFRLLRYYPSIDPVYGDQR